MTTVSLGDVVSIVARQVDPRLPQHASLPLINGENIESGTTRLLYRRTAASERAISPKYEVAVGDVVYSKLRPYLRKVVVADVPGLCSADLYPLRPDTNRVDPQWLAWLLVSEQFTSYAARTSARARMPKLNRDELLSYRIDLPKVADQQRTSAKLCRQFDAVAASRVAASEQLQRTVQLRVTAVRNLIPLPAMAGFAVVPLSECVEFLDHLREPVNQSERIRRTRGKPMSELYPYYGANGQAGWIDDYRFDEPLILLAEDGGAFGSSTRPIAYRIDGRSWVNNHAHVLRPLPHVDIDYLLHALAIRPDIGALTSGSTRGKLNREIAGQISVSMPPLPEQRRIAAVLRERLAQVDAMATAIDAEHGAIEALPSALLRRAFDDLVPGSLAGGPN